MTSKHIQIYIMKYLVNKGGNFSLKCCVFHRDCYWCINSYLSFIMFLRIFFCSIVLNRDAHSVVLSNTYQGFIVLMQSEF